MIIRLRRLGSTLSGTSSTMSTRATWTLEKEEKPTRSPSEPMTYTGSGTHASSTNFAELNSGPPRRRSSERLHCRVRSSLTGRPISSTSNLEPIRLSDLNPPLDPVKTIHSSVFCTTYTVSKIYI
jgi:hypothetical protein